MEIRLAEGFLETLHDGFAVSYVFVEGLGYTELKKEIDKYDGKDVILKLEVKDVDNHRT